MHSHDMTSFLIHLTAVLVMLTSRSSSVYGVIRKDADCRPQKPTVVTDPSKQPLVTCSNNGTVATLSCSVNFHCAEHLMIGLVWVGFFAPVTNYRTDDRTDTSARTENVRYQGYPLETEPRYSSTTHQLEGDDHVLEAVLEITSVTEVDYHRRFKCIVVTEYNYQAAGETTPDIQSRICRNNDLTQSHQQEGNSSGTLTYYIGTLLLTAFWSVEQIY
ncbi:uncharacterized protein LOC117342426 isoform X2 [Pecten maximus]|uniref:uncharacterized protein LOC117342426 isoform X2 n=1 Tax=Pecten maximus TaxID=6579 RepID=UPI0014590D3B|nr:uncharacterized protein LOC117342426 isoform X2 [Pecten maximus]